MDQAARVHPHVDRNAVRNWQSGGLHVDQTGMQDRDRLVGLLIPVLIAYLWPVSIGH